MISKSLHSLLHTIVDYAGLFAPASLPMDAAVSNYAAYRRDAHAWMLGRFIVPATRLDEMANALRAAGEAGGEHHWRVSALVGDDAESDVKRIASFNAESLGALVDAVELKAASAGEIARASAVVPREWKAYVEIPVADDPRTLIAAIGERKLRAKIRTGGVVPDAFPPVEHVARFVRECYTVGVGFKATAGLHHPLRSERALTYAPASPRGVMHGFLNVFLAAVFQYNGLTRGDALEMLRTETHAGVEFSDDGVAWKDYFVTLGEIATVRRRFAVGFGSCSFREPVDDLIQLGLLS